MTIKVESTTEPKVEAQPAVSGGAPKVDGDAVDNKSAPVADKATEQKPAAKSDAAEADAEEHETDDADSESEKDQDGDAKDKPRKKGGFQRRIDKLNARNSAAQAEIEHWKSMALKGAGESKAETKVEEPKQVDTAGKPNPDSFETHAEYVEALTDWKIETRDKAAKEQAAKVRLETEQSNLMKAHSSRVKDFATKTEDFQDVLESVDDVPVSPTIRELLITSENGPELMYELAKNRAEYERINKLPPLAAARELGKIESKLSAKEEPKQETKKITKAPQPINPVGGKGGPAEKSIDDPNLSQKDYEALRAKQRSA